MKKYYLFFAFSFSILLASCTKDNYNTGVSTNTFNAEAYFQNEVFQTVIFHFSYQNEVTKEQSGWFIDKYGNVKSYGSEEIDQTMPLPEGELCSIQQMANLYGLAETTHITLDMNDLYSNFKLIDIAFHGDMTENLEGDLESGTTSFIAFRAEGGQNAYNGYLGSSNGSCTEVEYPHDETMDSCESFEILNLELSGFSNQINQSTAATTIVTWMKEIQAQQNL